MTFQNHIPNSDRYKGMAYNMKNWPLSFSAAFIVVTCAFYLQLYNGTACT